MSELQDHEHISFLGSWTLRVLAVTCFHSQFFLISSTPTYETSGVMFHVWMLHGYDSYASYEPWGDSANLTQTMDGNRELNHLRGTQTCQNGPTMPNIWCLCPNFCVQNSLGWDVTNPCLEICTPPGTQTRFAGKKNIYFAMNLPFQWPWIGDFPATTKWRVWCLENQKSQLWQEIQ